MAAVMAKDPRRERITRLRAEANEVSDRQNWRLVRDVARAETAAARAEWPEVRSLVRRLGGLGGADSHRFRVGSQ